MSRDALVSDDQAVWDRIAAVRGGVRGPYGVLIHVPPLADRVAALEDYFRFDAALPEADRELVILATARELGARVLATGHYVASRRLPDGQRALYRAREAERDQSYFLFATTREQLADLRFPLGDQSKAEVRELAHRFGLAVADKHDSQDICFVPSGRYTEVIERLRPGAAEPGDIVDLNGRGLGRHNGIIHFTVGQRRGIGIAAAEPLYALRTEPAANAVVVGPRASLARTQVTARGRLYAAAGRVEAKLRYRSPAVRAQVEPTSRGFRLELDEPAYGVAPGQAAVLYESDVVVGYGVIAASH
jgi:tRNA-specific 2-thiouridylase